MNLYFYRWDQKFSFFIPPQRNVTFFWLHNLLCSSHSFSTRYFFRSLPILRSINRHPLSSNLTTIQVEEVINLLENRWCLIGHVVIMIIIYGFMIYVYQIVVGKFRHTNSIRRKSFHSHAVYTFVNIPSRSLEVIFKLFRFQSVFFLTLTNHQQRLCSIEKFPMS